MQTALEACGLTVIDETGVIYDLLADRWRLSSDMDVNYMMAAQTGRMTCLIPPGSGLSSP